MNVRIHDVKTVTEEFCDFSGGFTTRTINIVDKKGNHYSITLFGVVESDVTSSDIKHEEYTS